MSWLVAPAEPKQFLELGDGNYSTFPETVGGDFACFAQGKVCIVQRKECSDLIASVRSDDRMSTGMSKMQSADRAALLVEGDWRWDKNGVSQRFKRQVGKSGFTRAQYDGILMSAQANGVFVLFSDSIDDSIRVLRQYENFLTRESHDSLFTRPKSRIEEWGTARSRLFGIRWWQTYDGIGVQLAGDLWDAVGIPVTWNEGVWDRVKEVRGMGKKRIDSLRGAFE